MDHNKPYDRIDRVNNQILDILGDILIKHIDLSHLGFVTFTKIDTTRDLRISKVYYSVLNPKFPEEKINIEINKHRKPFKKYMSPELTMKHTPDLRFYFDDTYEYTEYVSKLINNLDKSDMYESSLGDNEDDFYEIISKLEDKFKDLKPYFIKFYF